MRKYSFILLLAFITSCSLNPSSSQSDLSPSNTVPSSKTKTQTLIPTSPTYTSIPSPTQTRTPEPTLSPTTSPSPYPTLQPLPTLNHNDRDAEIRYYMRTNSGCKLPCWWGIVPGNTKFSEAVQFFERLSGIINTEVTGYLGSGENRYILFLHNPGTDDSFGAHIGVEEGIVTSLRLDADITRMTNHIDQILSDYGSPSKIFIREGEYPSEEEREEAFYLFYDVVLVYDEYNFLAWYSFGALRYVEPFYVCVGISRPYFEIWSPDMTRDINWIQSSYKWWNLNPYFSIEEVSNLQIDTFSDYLVSIDGDRCFELDYDAIRSRTIGIDPANLEPTPTLNPTLIPYYLEGVYDLEK